MSEAAKGSPRVTRGPGFCATETTFRGHAVTLTVGNVGSPESMADSAKMRSECEAATLAAVRALDSHAGLVEALRDLADAARSACDARKSTALIEALDNADRLTRAGVAP